VAGTLCVGGPVPTLRVPRQKVKSALKASIYLCPRFFSSFGAW